MQEQDGLILFDFTQLVLRSVFSTPTGISRVELAYAQYLLAHHRKRVRFLISFPPTGVIVPTARAERFITATEAAWTSVDSETRSRQVDLLSRFLGVETGVFENRSSYVRQARPRRAQLTNGANLFMRTLFDTVRARNLKRFSRGRRHVTYVCVSGSNIPTPWITRWIEKSPNVSGVFLLHDLIPITHPEYVSKGMSQRHRRYVTRLANSASLILTNSEFTDAGLKQFAREEGLTLPRTSVSTLGTNRAFTRLQVLAENVPPYFVFIGTIEPRKNHILMLQVWQRLIAKHGSAAPKLILVGRRGWENENILDLIERGESLRGHVLECNGMCDDVLAALVANARALVLPSQVEGYGFPVAEALALGTPVLCSDLPSLREIAGEIAEYIDPLAGRGWARLIMEYAAPNSLRRQRQLTRLKHFQFRSWDDHFAVVETELAKLGRGQETHAAALGLAAAGRAILYEEA